MWEIWDGDLFIEITDDYNYACEQCEAGYSVFRVNQ